MYILLQLAVTLTIYQYDFFPYLVQGSTENEWMMMMMMMMT